MQSWINTQQPAFAATYATMALGGCKTWGQLVRLGAYLNSGITTILLDTANDVTVSVEKDQCSLEGFIRQVWAYNPEIRLIGISSPSWNGQDITNDALAPTPTNLTSINAAKVIFEYYGIAYVAYHQAVIDLVAAGHHLNEYVSGDTVHPSATGYALMATLAEAYLPSGGTSKPGSIPDRLYAASADYEYTGQIKNGTDYDSRTGAWTDNGSQVSSVAAGATITYSGTFRTFGWYYASGTYPNVKVAIDGTTVVNPFTTGWGGYDIGARAVHTIVIEVLTSITIDQFWAV